ncbi:MAG: hypothetical protein H6746_08075 [Deltaproteobacteria bacterium]|nr:hypothetical protein [Deltaproteobacteria bacterium]
MMITTELHLGMDVAIAEARSRRHEFSTVEHLLFALLNDEEAREVLTRSGADTTSLGAALWSSTEQTCFDRARGVRFDVHPSWAACPAAAAHCQGSGKEGGQVTVHVLVAIFAEQDSFAVHSERRLAPAAWT